MKIEGINLTADEGKTFIRIHDGYDMGSGIQLGIDTSTGEPREDKPEYYREETITILDIDTSTGEPREENPEYYREVLTNND